MPISSTTRKVGPLPGNGTATDFAFNFKVFDETDVRAIRTSPNGGDTDLVQPTNFSVILNADQDEDPGGIVRLTAALANDFDLTIVSNIPQTQPVDWQSQGRFSPEAMNDGLDRNTALVQQLSERLGRTITLPVTSQLDGVELPAPQANQLIAWNADGSGLSLLDPADVISVVAYGTTRADTFTGDGVEDTFILTGNPGALNNLMVSIDGVVQSPGVDYTWLGGTTLTFVEPPPDETNILVRYQQALEEGADVSGKLDITGGNIGGDANKAAFRSNIGLADRTLSNVTDTVLTDRIRSAERTRGAGFYDTIWLTSNEIDLTDAAPMHTQLNSFIASAQAQGKKLVGPKRRGGGNINIGAPLVFEHGRSPGSGDEKEVFFDLNGASLAPRHAGFAIEIDPLCTVANAGANPGHQVAPVFITNVHFALYANAAAKAIRIGRQGRVMDDFKHMRLEGVLVTHAAVGGVITIEGVTRHIDLQDVSTRGLGGLLIHSDTASGFVGDIRGRSCDFAGNATARPFVVRTSAAGAEARGIDIQMVVYGPGSLIDVQAGQSGDLWFKNVQWEGPPNATGRPDDAALQVYVGDGSILFDTFLADNYFKGFGGRALVATQAGTGSCRNFQLKGGIIEGTGDGTSATSGTVYFKDIGGLRMNEVVLRDIDSPSAINMDNAKDWSVTHCKLERRALGTANTNMIVATNGCNRFEVTDNVANVASGLDLDVFNDATTAGASCVVGRNVSDNIGGANAVVTSVVSADPLPIPRHVETVRVTGTTGFSQALNGFKGAKRKLIAVNGFSIFNAVGGFNDIKTKTGGTVTLGANGTFFMEHDGTQWFEF